MAYENIFERVSQQQGVPYSLLVILAKKESGFNPIAKSYAGARGIMQLMPANIKRFGVTNPHDPEENITAGAKLLRENYEKTGNWKDAIGWYNAGPRNWKRNRSGVMAQSPGYYKEIFGHIDKMASTYYDKRVNDTQVIPRSVADNTGIVSPFMPGTIIEGQTPTLSVDPERLREMFNRGSIPHLAGGGKNTIHIKESKKGSLHRALGIPQGEKIPASRLQDKPGDSPEMKKKKLFARNSKKWSH